VGKIHETLIVVTPVVALATMAADPWGKVVATFASQRAQGACEQGAPTLLV
jgi:hypothetical protein